MITTIVTDISVEQMMTTPQRPPKIESPKATNWDGLQDMLNKLMEPERLANAKQASEAKAMERQMREQFQRLEERMRESEKKGKKRGRPPSSKYGP